MDNWTHTILDIQALIKKQTSDYECIHQMGLIGILFIQFEPVLAGKTGVADRPNATLYIPVCYTLGILAMHSMYGMHSKNTSESF